MGKRMKILFTLLLVVIVIFIAAAIIMPQLGRFRPETARHYRINKLHRWHEKVEYFIKENDRLPNSLFELGGKDLKEGIWRLPLPGVGINREVPEDFDYNRPTDPNQFAQVVEYGLFSGRHGWFIRELKPGRIYPKMLMIDQDGKIHQLQEIGQRTDGQE